MRLQFLFSLLAVALARPEPPAFGGYPSGGGGGVDSYAAPVAGATGGKLKL